MKRRTFFGAIAGLFCLPWKSRSSTIVIPVNIEELVKQRFAENLQAAIDKQDRELEHLILYGDGFQPPLGVLTVNECREMERRHG